MGYKIIVILFITFQLSINNSLSQQYSCNYNNRQDSNVSSEACIYNKMYSYSNTDTLAKQLIFKILSLISLPTNFAIEHCDGINTCRAFVYDNGVRYIFYDRTFINNLTEKKENNWKLLAILSHELAHHLCGHTLISNADYEAHRNNELQADEFAGAMLARMGADSNEAISSLLSVTHPNCQDEIFNSYPCFENRKKAVLKGYNSISSNNRNQNFIVSNDLYKIDFSSTDSPVKNQGQDASCVGFSIAYAIEYEVKAKFNYSVQISPRYIYNSIGGTQFSGAYIEQAFEFVKSKGAIEESIWPYKSGDYNNNEKMLIADTTSNRYKIKEYFKLQKIDMATFRTILNQKKAIIITMKVMDYFQSDLSGKWYLKDKLYVSVFTMSSCIVGYDDKSKLLKFKNSWGKDWGDNGYGYLRYVDIEKLIISAYYIEM